MGGVQGPIEMVLVRNEALLLLRELVDPNIDKAFQATGSEVRERRVAAQFCTLSLPVGATRGLDDVRMELQALSELLRQPRELLLASERAQHDEDLLPLLQIGVLHNIVEIVCDDRLEEAEVRERGRTALEVRLLSACEELWATLDGQEDRVRKAVSGQAERDCGLEVAEHESLRHKAVGVRLVGRVDPEGVILERLGRD